MEFIGCHSYFLLFPFDPDKAQAEMPAGYTVAGDSTAVAGITPLRCETVVIGNSTVVTDVSLLHVSLGIIPPADVASGQDGYFLEFLLDDPILQAHLAEQGFDAKIASFTWGVEPHGPIIEVTVEGQSYYTIRIVEVPSEPPDEESSAERFHDGSTQQAWVDSSMEHLQTAIYGSFVVQGSGVANRIARAIPAGPAAENDGRMLYKFGQMLEE